MLLYQPLHVRMPVSLHVPSPISFVRARPIERSWNKNLLTCDATSVSKYLTVPLVFEVDEALTAPEPMPSPLWSTFCGLSNGLWVGTVGAYNPWSGKPEPLSPIKGQLEMKLCCVEERSVTDVDGDHIVRHSARAFTDDQLHIEMEKGGLLQFNATASTDIDWDTTLLHSESDGLFFFDGGSFSAGPLGLGYAGIVSSGDEEEEGVGKEEGEDHEGEEAVEELTIEDEHEFLEVTEIADDEMEDVPSSTAVLESCLHWNGQERVRVQLTILSRKGGGDEELDVDLLRVVVSKEAWEGLPGTYTSAEPSERTVSNQKSSSNARMNPSKLKGRYKVFEVSSSQVEDMSMRTGLSGKAHAYVAQETVCSLSLSRTQDAGGTLWLPHNTGVQLEMSPVADGGLGVSITTLWSPVPDILLRMSRKYDSAGVLQEVTHSTAIKI